MKQSYVNVMQMMAGNCHNNDITDPKKAMYSTMDIFLLDLIWFVLKLFIYTVDTKHQMYNSLACEDKFYNVLCDDYSVDVPPNGGMWAVISTQNISGKLSKTL